MSSIFSGLYYSNIIDDFIRGTISMLITKDFQEQKFKDSTVFSFLLNDEARNQLNIAIQITANENWVKLHLKIQKIKWNAMIKENCIPLPTKENTINQLKGFNKFLEDEEILIEENLDYSFFENNTWRTCVTHLIINTINTARPLHERISEIPKTSFAKLEKNQLNSKDYTKISNMYYDLIESFKFRKMLDIDNIYLYDNDGKNEFYYRNQGNITLKQYLCETDDELIEVLENYSNQLEKMKEFRIFFTKIPECSTNVVFNYSESFSESSSLPYADNIKLLLGFFDIDSYVCRKNADNFSAEVLSSSFLSSKLSLLFKLNNLAKDSSHYFLASCKMSIDQFTYKDIDNQSRLLGKGGFGQVFHNILNTQKVAIKLQIPKNDQKSNIQMIEEFNLMVNLNHPALLRPLGSVDYSNKFGIVLPQCSMNLGEFIKKKIERPKHQIKFDLWEYEGKMKMILAIAEGIGYMHARKYGHFDIKPSNIFLSEDFEPKIADFGLSKLILRKEDMKTRGCSLFYSPHEQVLGQEISFSADVWAFGTTMYILLFEKHPFEDLRVLISSESKEFQKKMYIEHIYDKLHRPAIPIDYQKNHPLETSLMQMCWHSNPEKRPTMEKIIKKLSNLQASTSYS